ncbi:hypothetical protein GGI07_004493 [Coemansia sp. Benny D115]|nr:hypothetical protein GGI07_004493 [Coemansia sp. Benny D115]
MADFGFDWDTAAEEEEEHIVSNEQQTKDDKLQAAADLAEADDPNAQDTSHTPDENAAGTQAPGTDTDTDAAGAGGGSLPPGVVVHRVAASDKQANPHGTTESELVEPMIEDKAKQLEVKTLENEDEDMSALEIVCKRSSSVYIFQRVWAAKEIGNLLEHEQPDVAMGVLVPIAMRLSEDRELFVRETMAQNLMPVLHFYYENKGTAFAGRSSSASKSPSHSLELQRSLSASPRSSTSASILDSGPDGEQSHSNASSSRQADTTSASPSKPTSLSKSPLSPKHDIVPPINIPGDEAFGVWLHRVLLTPHPSVSLPTQRATVSLGRRLSFEKYHTEIVHGVILSLVQNPIHQHLMRQRQRSKEMVVKTRASTSPPSRSSIGSSTASSSASSVLSSGFASLFGRRSWQSEKAPASTGGEAANSTDASDTSLNPEDQGGREDDSAEVLDLESIMNDNSPSSGSGFFVSPADEEARLELTRRKLLMLHMIHLVAVEFGASMRPAVFVPVVERSSKDRAFEVRRDAAAVLGSLAKAVSVDLAIDVLFQCFLQLSMDPIWQVRQSAARHALPGLALVLAARNSRSSLSLTSSSVSDHLAEFERKHSLHRFAQPSLHGSGAGASTAEQSWCASSTFEQRQSLNSVLSMQLPDKGSISGRPSRSDSTSGNIDPLSTYMYHNQPPRSIPDKQWLQLVERLASSREPSHHVRAAVFESIGKLTLALVDCPRTRDALVSLVINDIQRAHSDQGSGRFGLFGSSTSLQDLEDDDEDDDDEVDEETAAAEEAKAVMIRALGDVPGAGSGTTASGGGSSSLIPKILSGSSLRNKDSSSGPRSNIGGASMNTGASGVGGAGAGAGGGGRVGRLRAQRAVSRDILFQCAYNFPALLAALGPQGWDRIRDVYMQLSKTEHFEARQTLACSLHEVARILSASYSQDIAPSTAAAAQGKGAPARGTPSSSEANGMGILSSSTASHSADLESILCLFLIDGPEIKMGALRHLGDTLTWLTSASRVRCLPMIMQVFKHDGKQWRTRELMATQLVKLCHLFPAAIVVGSLLPQAVEWAHDPVAGVRAAVAPAFPIVFELTKLDPSTQVKFFETVISFSHAASFRGRLFFIEICSALLAHDQDPDADPVDFDQFFLPSLAALASDRVANVRIGLARLVRRMLENRMRRQSISATLADVWMSACPAGAADGAGATEAVVESDEDRLARRKTSEAISSASTIIAASLNAASLDSLSLPPSSSSSSSCGVAISRFNAHRSLESVARRPRRNTTPMRAHLLAMMVQQLAKDTDRDVLDLVRDLPGMSAASTPATAATTAADNRGVISGDKQDKNNCAVDAADSPQRLSQEARPSLERFPCVGSEGETSDDAQQNFLSAPPSPPLLPFKIVETAHRKNRKEGGCESADVGYVAAVQSGKNRPEVKDEKVSALDEHSILRSLPPTSVKHEQHDTTLSRSIAEEAAATVDGEDDDAAFDNEDGTFFDSIEDDNAPSALSQPFKMSDVLPIDSNAL